MSPRRQDPRFGDPEGRVVGVVTSAWAGGSFGPGGRERRIGGSGLQVARKIETEVPAVTSA